MTDTEPQTDEKYTVFISVLKLFYLFKMETVSYTNNHNGT